MGKEPVIYIYIYIYIYIFIYLFIYLFIYGCVESSLPRVVFSSCSESGLLFVGVCGLLIAVASLVVEHGLYVHGL